MMNYILGVQREDKVWFEITDDQSDRTQAHNQTTRITVYGFYLQENPIDLTIIDTPGYGDTRGIEKDKEIVFIWKRHYLSCSSHTQMELHLKMTAVEEAKIKCAVINDKNQPVFFLFNNCQSDADDEDYETRTIMESQF